MRASPHRARRNARALLAPALLVMILSGCRRSGPLVLRYDGTESCEVCRMAVTDPRYGGQAQTRTGKLRTFDSIECLTSYYVTAARGDRGPLAVGPAADLDALQRELGGTTLNWPDVLALMAREALAAPGARAADTGE